MPLAVDALAEYETARKAQLVSILYIFIGGETDNGYSHIHAKSSVLLLVELHINTYVTRTRTHTHIYILSSI